MMNTRTDRVEARATAEAEKASAEVVMAMVVGEMEVAARAMG